MAVEDDDVLEVYVESLGKVDADERHCSQSHGYFLLVYQFFDRLHTHLIAFLHQHPQFEQWFVEFLALSTEEDGEQVIEHPGLSLEHLLVSRLHSLNHPFFVSGHLGILEGSQEGFYIVQRDSHLVLSEV